MNQLRIRQAPRSTAGFTLVEFLISAAIALIIFAVGFTILNGAGLARNEAQARLRYSDQARIFFQMLERDLASAYPGPWTDPALSDLNQKVDLVYTVAGETQGNVLEMTVKGESTSQPNQILSVRYFVYPANQPTRRLYRQTVLNPVGPAKPFNQPIPDAYSGSNEFALFPDVDNMTADYYRWDEVSRSWTAATPPNYSDATHLDVKITFRDPNEKLSPAQRIRIYHKLIAIPEVFRQ